jgi:sterol desaturase/sphingolipid hydroxylase (fatty acid hydroxylase superfamily)
VAAWLGDWAEALSWWSAVGIFLALAGWESVRPQRDLTRAVMPRWMKHMLLYAVGLCILAVVAPAMLAELVFGNRDEHWLFAAIGRAGGEWAVLCAGVLLIDLYVYAMHRVQHRVFVLWRFHAVHHSDVDVDVSTGWRHHPGEFVVSAALATVVFVLLGVPAWVFPVYGVVSTAVGTFQHMNGRLPAWLEEGLGMVIVTPAMHRVHHAVAAEYHDTNFGNVLSLWDRLFGTYLALDPDRAAVMSFGLEEAPGLGQDRLLGVLALPFALRRPSSPKRRIVTDPVA